jgi:hypothetical protein
VTAAAGHSRPPQPPALTAGPGLAAVERAESSARAELGSLEEQIQRLTRLAEQEGPRVAGEVAVALSAADGQKAVITQRLEHASRDRQRLQGGPVITPYRPGPGAGPARPRPVIGDADGYHLRPDPLHAQTPADLMAVLRRFRIWAGEPSFRRMAQASRDRLSASTVHAVLHSEALPSLQVLLAIVSGCGGSNDDLKAFATAWRTLRFAVEDAPAGRVLLAAGAV